MRLNPVPLPLAALLLFALAACGERQVREEWRPGVPKRSGLLVSGKQDGPWTYWYDKGQKQAEGGWDHDFQNGAWSWWYDSGRLKQQGQYDGHGLDPAHHSSGVRIGHWRHFYDNGQLYCEGDYADDRQTGTWTYATREGKPFAAGSFAAGIKEGEWTWFQGDGQPRQRGSFAGGLKTGTWTSWKADGTIAVREIYAAGRLVATEAPPAPAAAAAPPAVPAATEPAAPVAAAPAAVAPAPVVAPPAKTVPDAGLPTAGEPALSPIQVAPVLWTASQEANAEALIRHYTNRVTDSVIGGYDDGSFGGDGDRQRRDLIGKPLPQTRFLSASGDVIDLKDLMGKKQVLLVVLRGFSGQVCLYCATQTAALSNSIQKFRDLGVEVVIVYPGPVEAVPAFVQAVQSLRKDPPPMPLALDVSLLLVRALGIEDNLAKPASLIIDRQGVVRYAYVGKTIADRPAVNDLLHALARSVK
jgi:antitoxin component YwqK of YwqJK toxin-antitoxin module/peroxiredoxin